MAATGSLATGQECAGPSGSFARGAIESSGLRQSYYGRRGRFFACRAGEAHPPIRPTDAQRPQAIRSSDHSARPRTRNERIAAPVTQFRTGNHGQRCGCRFSSRTDGRSFAGGAIEPSGSRRSRHSRRGRFFACRAGEARLPIRAPDAQRPRAIRSSDHSAKPRTRNERTVFAGLVTQFRTGDHSQRYGCRFPGRTDGRSFARGAIEPSGPRRSCHGRPGRFFACRAGEVRPPIRSSDAQ